MANLIQLLNYLERERYSYANSVCTLWQPTFSQSWPRLFDWLQITLAPEDLDDIGLFRKHIPICLDSNLRQTAPPLEICRIPFVAVC